MASPSSPLRLPTSLAIIFGSFTLGFHVAIQGPTLMDLIDLLHINNDIMSYTLAFASLAYSLGGLLSGFLFNYVNRQVLIACFYVVFGVANILTPFISNYIVFSVLTVFKMMCAGGTDCGANVWMLELWPGKDAWLQALHFSFAVGCALGPLIVEPFLSHEEHNKDGEIGAKLSEGGAIINDQTNESRIYIPYGVSGTLVLIAATLIAYLYWLGERQKKQACNIRPILLNSVQQQQQHQQQIHHHHHTPHPAAIEAGLNKPETILEEEEVPLNANSVQDSAIHKSQQSINTTQQSRSSSTEPPTNCPPLQQVVVVSHQHKPSNNNNNSSTQIESQPKQQQEQQVALINNANQVAVPNATGAVQSDVKAKITSKCREEVGRPPYYVMFAIALSALCLSFYCGIEITSMNYLATFAVNIDLQLPKSTAALMSSALTISFAVGRAFGIWVAARMKPHRLFYLCACVMATGNVFMLIFANTAETLLWYSICLFGVGCGPMFPAIVSFYDDKISKVTNTVSGIFILGSMFNVALNSLIIGHYIIDNALILIVCNLIGSILLMCLFATLHMLTKVKKNQRLKKFKLQQERQLKQLQLASDKLSSPLTASLLPPSSPPLPLTQQDDDQAPAATSLLTPPVANTVVPSTSIC